MSVDPAEIRRRAAAAQAAEQARRTELEEARTARQQRWSELQAENYARLKGDAEKVLPGETIQALRRAADRGETSAYVEVHSSSNCNDAGFDGAVAGAQNVAEQLNAIPGIHAEVTVREWTQQVIRSSGRGPSPSRQEDRYEKKREATLRVEVDPDS